MTHFSARYQFSIDARDERYANIHVDDLIHSHAAGLSQRVVSILEWSVSNNLVPWFYDIDASVVAELMLDANGKPTTIIDAEFVDVTPAGELPAPPKMIEGHGRETK